MSIAARHVSSVASATMVSRILGLARDVLMFAGLGAGPYLSAFVVAFTIPNLLRRLLGEGALTSAVVPVFSSNLEREGPSGAFRVLNAVLSRLVALLIGVTLVGGLLLLLSGSLPGAVERWQLASRLAVLLLPYGIFICAAAMFAAQLNVMHRFLVPALSPIWLNLAMILALGLGMLVPGVPPRERVVLLSLAVLVGGVLQALVPAAALRREGWHPAVETASSESLAEIWKLLLPGMVGAAILQFNLLLSRLLAFSIDDAATSVLYLANRLVELPYGVFAVAVTTVAFPRLARAVARNDTAGFSSAYSRGRGLIWLITLPAAVGLGMLARPILQTLFQWGLFDAADVERTVRPLQVMAFGLPFFSWTILATRGLHSWKEMRLPVRFGAANAVLNLGLSLALMPFWRETGLAVANVLASILLTVLMEHALWRRKVIDLGRGAWSTLGRMGLASAVMALAIGLWSYLVGTFGLAPKAEAVLLVLTAIPLGIGIYFAACVTLRISAVHTIAEMFRKSPRVAPAAPDA